MSGMNADREPPARPGENQGTSESYCGRRAGRTPWARRLLPFLLSAATGCLLGGAANAQVGVVLRLMPMGDSITAGYQSSTGDGYRGPLFNQLASQVGTLDFVGSQIDGTMADSSNEGHYGYKIADIAGLATGVVQSYRPNIILLHIGSNDLNSTHAVGNTPQQLASLIDQIVAAEPDATLLVAQLIPSQYPATESAIEAYNAQIPAIVQARVAKGEHVAVVSMDNLPASDYADTLHPNDAGYAQMAANWDAGIQGAINAGWIGSPVPGSIAHPVGIIASGIAGECLNDINGSGTDGNPIGVAQCSTAASQQWDPNGNGEIVINGKCLDNAAGGTANGNKVGLWDCNGGSNQVWTARNGTLFNPASNKCLDDPNFGTNPGTQLEIWECNGGINQKWQLPTVGLVTSGVAGKCLDNFGGNNADLNPVDSYGCNQTVAQQWRVANNLVKIGGKCLDITAGGTTSGTPAELYHCTGGANQVWVPTNGTLVNPASGKCLDNPGSSATNGTRLDIATCSGTPGQSWTLPTY